MTTISNDTFLRLRDKIIKNKYNSVEPVFAGGQKRNLVCINLKTSDDLRLLKEIFNQKNSASADGWIYENNEDNFQYPDSMLADIDDRALIIWGRKDKEITIRDLLILLKEISNELLTGN